MVRTLGPGSVSSLLKMVLDVIHVVLWVALAGATSLIFAVLLLSFKPALLADISFGGKSLTGPWVGPVAALVPLGAALYFGGATIIVGRLRRIFQTLIAGDPFHPDNARRLRVIGVALAALEGGRYLAGGLIDVLSHGRGLLRFMGGGVSLTTWFAVLAIVVLAEVFREGARLRGEAELTI